MTSYPALYIGIDGGGSGSRARIRDGRGALLAEAQGGPANTYQDLPGSLRNLRELVSQAARLAGLESHVLLAGVGLAGLETSVDPRQITAEALGVGRAVVRVDAHIACLGAFNGADGAIVIVGTGSIGYGIRGATVSMIGGWGLPVGDQGSGGWLGLEAVKQAAFVMDGMAPASALSDLVMARIGGTKFAASSWTGKASPADYAGLAPELFHLAEQGEAQAAHIIRAGVAEVLRLAQALETAGHAHICLLGGLSRLYLPYLPAALTRRLVEPAADALDGAIQLARSHQPGRQ